jgi:hypothetical protein
VASEFGEFDREARQVRDAFKSKKLKEGLTQQSWSLAEWPQKNPR